MKMLSRLSVLRMSFVLLVVAAVGAETGISAAKAPPLAEMLKPLKDRKHPYLLFTDIKETPGWEGKRRNQFINSSVVPLADRLAMKQNFANRNVYDFNKARSAVSLAFSYQLTGKKKYADKCKEALKNIGNWQDFTVHKIFAHSGTALADCALAYDLVAETLSPRENKQIVKALGRFAEKLYSTQPTWDNVWHHVTGGAGLGMAACAIPEYKGRKSGPEDWLRAATIYQFLSNPNDKGGVRDPAMGHSGGPFASQLKDRKLWHRAGVNRTVNPGGYDRRGGYRFQWVDDVVKWAVVYHNVFQRNLLNDFPIVRKYMNYIIWEMMPNGHGSCANMGDGRRWLYTRGVLHLLTEEERQAHLFYLNTFPKGRFAMNLLPKAVLFSLPEPAGKGRPPSWTTFISPEAEHAVFRGSWKADSDWLFLNVYNYLIPRGREQVHHDNMSFQLYSRGDYLMCDGGEVRKRTYGYGPTGAVGHNLILIDGSGPVKGIGKFLDPAYMKNYSLCPWLEFVDARMDFTHREDPDKRYENPVALSSAVKWGRTILYPGKEYFLIIDALHSQKSHQYEWLFHLSSLNLVPTTKGGKKLHPKVAPCTPGHVIGELSIGKTKVDWTKDVVNNPVFEFGGEVKPHWLSPVKQVGKYIGGTVLWRTKSIPTWKMDPWPYYFKGEKIPDSYKRDVELKMVLSPAPEKIAVQRTWGIANQRSFPYEVDHPLIRFRHKGKDKHVITALLPRYAMEPQRNASEIKVAGDGTALKIESGETTDLVGVGKGGLEFEEVSTDAEISLVRKKADKVQTALIIRGRSLKYQAKPLISTSEPVPHAAFHFLGKEILGHVNLEEATKITVRCDFSPKAVTYKTDAKDGFVWSKPGEPISLPFKKQGALLVVECPKGAGSVVIK